MKFKLLLSPALVLSGVYTAFALALFVQLKPDTIGSYSNVPIRSEHVPWDRNVRIYQVVLLPQKNFQPLNWAGDLSIRDGTNHLVSCKVEGVMLSDRPAKGDHLGDAFYMAMTNRFSRPLNGAKIFTFQVATNLLASSEFSRFEHNVPDYALGFTLKDFSNEE